MNRVEADFDFKIDFKVLWNWLLIFILSDCSLNAPEKYWDQDRRLNSFSTWEGWYWSKITKNRLKITKIGRNCSTSGIYPPGICAYRPGLCCSVSFSAQIQVYSTITYMDGPFEKTKQMNLMIWVDSFKLKVLSLLH